MSAVQDLSGNNSNGVWTRPYNQYNRTNAGDPNASVTPQYAGEIILDTTNSVLWKALGVLNSTWVALTSPV